MLEIYFAEYIINEPTSMLIGILTTLIGTFVGFLGAYYISAKSEEKQKYSEIEKKRDFYEKRLTHLSNLITNSLDITEKQLTSYEDLAVRIKKEPTENHMPQILASSDLHRIQKMDTEGIFLAYNDIIKESQDKLKDYKNIYSTVDFIYLRLQQALDSNNKHVEFCYRDQMYIKEKVEGLSDELIKIIKTIENNDNNFKHRDDYNFLISWHKQYYELIENHAKLKEIEEKVLLPYDELLRKDYTKTPYFPILYDFTSKILVKFNHLKKNSILFADEMNNMRNEMNKAVVKLGEINNKIKSSLSSSNKSSKK